MNPNIFRSGAVPAVIAGIGLSVLTGCSTQGNFAVSKADMVSTPATEGEIYSDARLRFNAEAADDRSDGSTNICDVVEETFAVKATEVYTSNGHGDDMNGKWVGIKVTDLPKKYRTGNCEDDADDIVWIIAKKTSFGN